MAYHPPVNDILFALKSACGFDELLDEGLYPGLDQETVEAVVTEAGRFAAEVLDPLNQIGDRQGSRLADGTVATPKGWKEAYQAFAESGWSALPCPEEFGGQELPQVVSTAVCELWNSANLAFGLCPLLTQGAIDAIEIGGSDALKAKYLPKLVSGEWSGTMNLTEPQAGSDLGALTTKAEPVGDGTYKIFGTKIFITYGDHEMTDNIIHLVLARLPDAPPGTKGISLFLVPKRLVNEDGSLGERNDVVCTGLEEKLGIHASPTCVMTYGEKGGAIGYLVGEENRGLATMFIMMNAARLAVGVQGVSVAERATQRAVEYANERRQGKALSGGGFPAPIVYHADVRRMLLTMQAMTQAARSICLVTTRETDIARLAEDPQRQAKALARVALLTPVAKAFSTDVGCEVASLGVQVHGGMGFVEETGAAQYYRDARILPIYEGTNGIQALDLVGRKLGAHMGRNLRRFFHPVSEYIDRIMDEDDLEDFALPLAKQFVRLQQATGYIAQKGLSNPDEAGAAATDYMRLFGLVAMAYLWVRAVEVAQQNLDGDEADFYKAKITTAKFYFERLLPQTGALFAAIMSGSKTMMEMDEAAF